MLQILYKKEIFYGFIKIKYVKFFLRWWHPVLDYQKRLKQELLTIWLLIFSKRLEELQNAAVFDQFEQSFSGN